MPGPNYFSLTRSISWLLMPWLLTSPGHQQPFQNVSHLVLGEFSTFYNHSCTFAGAVNSWLHGLDLRLGATRMGGLTDSRLSCQTPRPCTGHRRRQCFPKIPAQDLFKRGLWSAMGTSCSHLFGARPLGRPKTIIPLILLRWVVIFAFVYGSHDWIFAGDSAWMLGHPALIRPIRNKCAGHVR